MLSYFLRNNGSVLCRSHVAPLVMQRFFGIRPNLSNIAAEFVHPESRHAVPQIYVSSVLQKPKTLDVNLRRRLWKKYGRVLTKHPVHEDNRCFTEKYRWAEFRHKLIYGF